MSSHPPLGPPVAPPPPSPARFVRVEYLDFQSVAEHREFRFRVYGGGEASEFRFRIAIAAFDDGRVRLQDGPDVCYQKLLKAVDDGETASPDMLDIGDADLARYREAHTHVPKHRSWTPLVTPVPAVVPRKPPATPSRPLAVGPLVGSDVAPALEEGQRVTHAIFGAGVTTTSSRGHTAVFFDQDGPKTFVTSMLKVEVLSAPRTWETGPRGKNRPCKAPAPR